MKKIVDFIIKINPDEFIAIEVKGTARLKKGAAKGIMAFEEDIPLKEKIIVCNEKRARRQDNGILILPVEEFCIKLWNGEIF